MQEWEGKNIISVIQICFSQKRIIKFVRNSNAVFIFEDKQEVKRAVSNKKDINGKIPITQFWPLISCIA